MGNVYRYHLFWSLSYTRVPLPQSKTCFSWNSKTCLSIIRETETGIHLVNVTSIMKIPNRPNRSHSKPNFSLHNLAVLKPWQCNHHRTIASPTDCWFTPRHRMSVPRSQFLSLATIKAFTPKAASQNIIPLKPQSSKRSQRQRLVHYFFLVL